MDHVPVQEPIPEPVKAQEVKPEDGEVLSGTVKITLKI